MRKLLMTLAAVALVAGASTAGTVVASASSAPATQRVTWHATEKVNPFTGKETHNYVETAAATYYQWKYAPNDSYCVFDDGADVDLYSCSSEINDYWSVNTWNSGSWFGYAYLTPESDINECLSDPGGANNIRVELGSNSGGTACPEVGGTSWNVFSWGYNGAVYVENAIVPEKNPDGTFELVTEPFALKQGAWIVTAQNAYNSVPANDMLWTNLPIN